MVYKYVQKHSYNNTNITFKTNSNIIQHEDPVFLLKNSAVPGDPAGLFFEQGDQHIDEIVTGPVDHSLARVSHARVPTSRLSN